MSKIPKEDFQDILRLYMSQKWLTNKENELVELLAFCDDSESKKLVLSMLQRFINIDNDNLRVILDNITEYIISQSGFQEERIQLVALTYDAEADSGQKVLDFIRHPLYSSGWRNVETVNQIGKSIRMVSKGRNQIILVDEFIGSGQTIKNRITYLQNNIHADFEYRVVFLAGIKQAIEELALEGLQIFCPIQLDRGISHFYQAEELRRAEDLMLDLELKLSPWINNKELYKYSFGWGGAEALYSMENLSGNTPNSTFPIFWWLKDKDNRFRNTILNRTERGFQDEQD